jgi:hypothetical protein
VTAIGGSSGNSRQANDRPTAAATVCEANAAPTAHDSGMGAQPLDNVGRLKFL